jgi:hypothetical protein
MKLEAALHNITTQCFHASSCMHGCKLCGPSLRGKNINYKGLKGKSSGRYLNLRGGEKVCNLGFYIMTTLLCTVAKSPSITL